MDAEINKRDDIGELVLKELDSISYLRAFIRRQIRPDGRNLVESRNKVISTGCYTSSESLSQPCGSSLVRYGDTLMAAGVIFQIGTPSQQSPSAGDIKFDVTLGSVCSTLYERSKSDDAYILEDFLMNVFSTGGIFDLDQLCIEKYKYAFRLIVSVVCISHAGNLADAALTAVVRLSSRFTVMFV
jgi:exosome complex RNA-binding protein Rrp42 (RNase PH superfamily)